MWTSQQSNQVIKPHQRQCGDRGHSQLQGDGITLPVLPQWSALGWAVGVGSKCHLSATAVGTAGWGWSARGQSCVTSLELSGRLHFSDLSFHIDCDRQVLGNGISQLKGKSLSTHMARVLDSRSPICYLVLLSCLSVCLSAPTHLFPVASYGSWESPLSSTRLFWPGWRLAVRDSQDQHWENLTLSPHVPWSRNPDCPGNWMDQSHSGSFLVNKSGFGNWNSVNLPFCMLNQFRVSVECCPSLSFPLLFSVKLGHNSHYRVVNMLKWTMKYGLKL